MLTFFKTSHTKEAIRFLRGAAVVPSKLDVNAGDDCQGSPSHSRGTKSTFFLSVLPESLIPVHLSGSPLPFEGYPNVLMSCCGPDLNSHELPRLGKKEPEVKSGLMCAGGDDSYNMSPSGSLVKSQPSTLLEEELGSPAKERYWSCFSKLESLRGRAMGGGVVMLSVEKLPAVKEGIYDVYGKKVQPGRTWLSHYKTAFSSQRDIFYHLRGQRPQ